MEISQKNQKDRDEGTGKVMKKMRRWYKNRICVLDKDKFRSKAGSFVSSALYEVIPNGVKILDSKRETANASFGIVT